MPTGTKWHEGPGSYQSLSDWIKASSTRWNLCLLSSYQSQEHVTRYFIDPTEELLLLW